MAKLFGNADVVRRLRQGKLRKKLLTLGINDDAFDVAVVLLSTDDMMEIDDLVEEKYNGKEVKEATRARYYNTLLAWKSCREYENPDKLLIEDFNEFKELMDLEDIQRINEMYNELIVDKCPKLELITEEQFEDLKDFFGKVALSDINIASVVHLTYCRQTLVSEGLLTNN